MYHSIQGRKSSGSGCDYEIKEEEFENQLNYLVENGYSSLLFDDFVSSEKLPQKGIVITFDDGHLSNYTIAFPILCKFGFRAEFFVTPGQISESNRMKVHHLKEMINQGMAVGSHGLTHAYLDDLSNFDAKKELQQSRENLSAMLGTPISSFSAPGGRFHARHVQMAVDCGYHVFCTSRPGVFNPQSSMLNVPRMPVCQRNAVDFTKIVTVDSFFYLKKIIITYWLNMAKKILGNKHYENIRSFIMQR